MKSIFSLVWGFGLLCVIEPAIAQTKDTLNLSFEQLQLDSGLPQSWDLDYVEGQQKSHLLELDGRVKYHGQYALSIARRSRGASYAAADYPIKASQKGRWLTLKGYVKTENVQNGYAGLWMRLDGTDQVLQSDMMRWRGITGTTDWKEYKITLPYDTEEISEIHIGGLLTGDGKMWIDALELTLDGKPLTEAPIRKLNPLPAKLDTMFRLGTGIHIRSADIVQTEALADLGLVWGFVKYHHPAVAKGMFNMDAELFRFLPQFLQAKDQAASHAMIETWLDRFGIPDTCNTCLPPDSGLSVKLMPDYGWMFREGHFPTSLRDKLGSILRNRNHGPHYYLEFFQDVGNPRFLHEETYRKWTYPDAGMRILTVFRYWNMIRYFFPYRHLIEEDWNRVLPDVLPAFLAAVDSTEYTVACLKLIARIHDTHANVWGRNTVLAAWRGQYFAPIQARFVEHKLVVTGYYQNPDSLQKIFPRGAVIAKIDGIAVETLVQKHLSTVAASNYETQLRDMAGLLLRSVSKTMSLDILDNGKAYTINCPLFPEDELDRRIDGDPAPGEGSHKVLDGNIGYLFPGKYLNSQLPAIKKAFRDTRGMIIDMRTYPGDFMPFVFGSWIIPGPTPFVKFTAGDLKTPGLFRFGTTLAAGQEKGEKYNRPVVVIVNATTQSQAEYTTMAFQVSPYVTVIGSTTAAADGNVSDIILPGNIRTMISGIGVYYPDGTETQRRGVRINREIRPTIRGIREGRDELLEEARKIILSSAAQ